jgi:hypothetical protein
MDRFLFLTRKFKFIGLNFNFSTLTFDRFLFVYTFFLSVHYNVITYQFTLSAEFLFTYSWKKQGVNVIFVSYINELIAL